MRVQKLPEAVQNLAALQATALGVDVNQERTAAPREFLVLKGCGDRDGAFTALRSKTSSPNGQTMGPLLLDDLNLSSQHSEAGDYDSN